MGAFGELLDRHFGGTKHDVKTWNTPQNDTEIDEIRLDKLIGDCESITNKYKTMMGLIENQEVMSQMFKTEKGKEKFVEWAKKFIDENNES